VNNSTRVDVYIDYVCPYVHAAMNWLQDVKQQLGDDAPQITWRFFPLEQVNAPADVEERVWNLPPDNRSQARNSMHAGAAALRQGQDAFEKFSIALLALKHEEGQDHGKRATLDEAARRAELDPAQFAEDLEDRALLLKIRDDYTHGREELGVFGTPTFVFPGGESAYLQVRPTPPAEDAVPLWNDFVEAVCNRPYLREIKRPKRPA
jgi:predicted DsbA family dithiol-disulfide isomerase